MKGLRQPPLLHFLCAVFSWTSKGTGERPDVLFRKGMGKHNTEKKIPNFSFPITAAAAGF